jgi:hypothetical protein
MKNWIVESIILAIALLAFGILLNRGINNFTDRDRVVTVKGLAEMEVPADKVIWPLMYKDLGNDLTTLYTNIQSKNRTIVDFLRSNGITDDDDNPMAHPVELRDLHTPYFLPSG